MKNQDIIWGIIGCGDVVEVKSGPAFQKCENSQLMGVMRRDANKAKDFAERYNVPLSYNDTSKLLENSEINAIYIATPPSTHLEYALQALNAGKHVYLEKPMVLSMQESNLLCEAVKNSNQKLVVAHYRRYLPMYLKVKALIQSNVIGQVKFVDIKYLQAYNSSLEDNNWRINQSISGGGYFHDLAPHQLDLMYYFFGDYTVAKGFSIIQNSKFLVPDIVNGVIKFNGNIPFKGIWNFSAPEYSHQDNCTIYGDLGSISFPFYGDRVIVNVNSETKTYNFDNPVNIQQPFIQETINYFLGKRDNPCSVEEGARIINIIEIFSKGL